MDHGHQSVDLKKRMIRDLKLRMSWPTVWNIPCPLLNTTRVMLGGIFCPTDLVFCVLVHIKIIIDKSIV